MLYEEQSRDLDMQSLYQWNISIVAHMHVLVIDQFSITILQVLIECQ